MPQLLFTEAEWPSVTADAVTRMARHVERFTTPISREVAADAGEAWGSGSYVEHRGKKFLLTNEHVARAIRHGPLGHKFFGDENFFRVVNGFHADPAPIDAAVSLIEDAIWTKFPHQGCAVPSSRLAQEHAPVEGELLFFAGYSGERSRFAFGSLVSRGTPYLARECALPERADCDPDLHFALAYDPGKATSVDGSLNGLPLPPGFSGSLIWNTRVVEKRMNGAVWTPDEAVVTGIVWGWDSETCLIATRIEYLPFESLASAAIEARTTGEADSSPSNAPA